MKYLLATILLLGSYSSLNAQLKTGRSSEQLINISFTPQQFFNKRNVVNDKNQPTTISTNNTFGYNFGLSYQYIHKTGLSFTAGLQLGYQEHNIIVEQDMSYFEDQPGYSVLNTMRSHDVYSLKAFYINQRLMLGYKKNLGSAKRGWAIEGKAGIATKAYSKCMNKGGEMLVVIYNSDNNPNEYYGKTAFVTVPYFGNTSATSKWNINPFKNNLDHTFEAYVGLSKGLHKGIFKTINCGVEFTKTIQDPDYFLVQSYNAQGKIVSVDKYEDRTMSVGLYIGVGLW